MTLSRKMDTNGLIEVLKQGQWYFMFAICVGLGVFSNESYLILKHPERPRFKDMFAKLCVAVFICLLVHGYYDYKKYPVKYEYVPLMLSSFLYYQTASFMKNTVWPLLSKIIVGLLNGGKQDDK